MLCRSDTCGFPFNYHNCLYNPPGPPKYYIDVPGVMGNEMPGPISWYLSTLLGNWWYLSQRTTYLTHWGWEKMAAILWMTFSNALFWMKMYEFQLRVHLIVFLWVEFIIFQHWLGQSIGPDEATNYYLKRWWLVYWHIYASLGLSQLNTASSRCHANWC